MSTKTAKEGYEEKKTKDTEQGSLAQKTTESSPSMNSVDEKKKSHSKTKRYFWMFGLLTLGSLGVYTGVSTVATFVLITPERHSDEPNLSELTIFAPQSKDVVFKSRSDGLNLSGWYLQKPNSSSVIIMVHGKDSNRTREFKGRALELAKALYDSGFGVLMLDLRGHGKSQSSRFGFGRTEKNDILGAVDFLKATDPHVKKIGLLGASMGAATSMFAAPEDPSIRAVVEDSGYGDFESVLHRSWKTNSQLPEFFIPGVLWLAHWLLGYDITAIRPMEAVGRFGDRALLIIHGTADEKVSVEEAFKIKGFYPKAEMWFVQGAIHVGSFKKEPATYLSRVTAFFHQNL